MQEIIYIRHNLCVVLVLLSPIDGGTMKLSHHLHFFDVILRKFVSFFIYLIYLLDFRFCVA